MDGFVAVTDRGWYDHLLKLSTSEANFWRPSTRPFRFAIGMPFLFKLKAPDRAIVGYGFFAGFSVLPDWLAWDTFGESNGVASLNTLQERLHRVQQQGRIEADPAGRIGCCLIAESHFFPPNQWVDPPANWHVRTQTGATYDLMVGEGQRVWQQCLATVGFRQQVAAETSPRYGEPSVYLPRLGQGIFRVRVLDAYGRACAVTQEHSLPVLEAAHIRPYASGGEHLIQNGLTLRSDLHRLFDRGYVTVDEQSRLVVGQRLRAEFENGHSYYGFHGQALTLPTDVRLHPDPDALTWHRDRVFLG
jgi:putative restriction endonuclease